MSPSFLLQEGAILLGDAHYSHFRPELFYFLEDIASQKIKTPQLILMGDLLDALFGSISYTLEQNEHMVKLLQDISHEIELIYLEGNHDFNLKKIFPHAKIYSIKEQPVVATYNEKTVALAHGDFDGALGYKIYTALIRNPIVLKVLNSVDMKIDDKIMENIESHLSKKDDCKEFVGFEEYIKKRGLEHYGCDVFIEGHYHQNKEYTFEGLRYINLAAFACNQRYFIVKSSQDSIFLEEKKFLRE